jgi:deoxyribonuclease-4
MDDRAEGLARTAAAYARCLDAVEGITILIETTAGGGTALGSTFEELAALRDAIPGAQRDRVGFCADTCHLYAAGYDLAADWEGVWDRWDRLIGLEHLRCLHLNDSVGSLGSRRDRHALIAEGELGPEPFRRIMRDPRFAHIPKIIETPKGNDVVRTDRRMLRRLRAYGARRQGRQSPSPGGRCQSSVVRAAHLGQRRTDNSTPYSRSNIPRNTPSASRSV